MESDPIGLAAGPNTYGYVLANSLSFIDVFGLAGCYVDFPGYPITIPNTSWKIPLYHAGILSYDNQTGSTTYYEYGRYDSNYGQVKQRPVPNVQIDRSGNATKESMNVLEKYITKNIGHGTEAKLTCDAKADSKKINDFAVNRKNDANRPPYSWNPLHPNTCTTFASDALSAGQSQ